MSKDFDIGDSGFRSFDLFYFLIAMIVLLLPFAFWHFYDAGFFFTDSSLMWHRSLVECTERVKYWSPPMLLPLWGCGLLQISGFNIPLAHFLHGLVILILLFGLFSWCLSFFLNSNLYLASLVVCFHPAIYMQAWVFEMESLWLLQSLASLGCLLCIVLLRKKTPSIGLLIFFVAGLETRPFECLMVIPFMMLISTFYEERGRPFLALLLSLTLWVVPLVSVIAELTSYLSPNYLFVFSQVTLVALALIVGRLLGIVSYSLGAQGVGSIIAVFWASHRIPELLPWISVGLDEAHRGGFFHPLSLESGVWRYIGKDILLRLALPLFLLPLLCVQRPLGRDSKSGWILCVPFLCVVGVILCGKFIAPHYLLSHVLVATFGIFSMRPQLHLNRSLSALLLSGVLLFHLGTIGSKALRIESLKYPLFSSTDYSSFPLPFRAQNEFPIPFLKEMPVDWYTSSDTIGFFQFLKGKWEAARQIPLTPFDFQINLFGKKPIWHVLEMEKGYNSSVLDQVDKIIIFYKKIPIKNVDLYDYRLGAEEIVERYSEQGWLLTHSYDETPVDSEHSIPPFYVLTRANR